MKLFNPDFVDKHRKGIMAFLIIGILVFLILDIILLLAITGYGPYAEAGYDPENGPINSAAEPYCEIILDPETGDMLNRYTVPDVSVTPEYSVTMNVCFEIEEETEK